MGVLAVNLSAISFGYPRYLPFVYVAFGHEAEVR
jgi:hypothetical protein